MSEMTFSGITKVFTEDERVYIKMYMDNDGKYVVEIFVKDDCRNLSLKNNDDFDMKKNKNDIKRGEDIQTGIKFLKNKSVEKFTDILKSSVDELVDVKVTNQNSVYKLELGTLNDEDEVEYMDYIVRSYYTNAKALTRGYEGEIKILEKHLTCDSVIFIINTDGDKVINVLIPKIMLKTILCKVFEYDFEHKGNDDIRFKITYDEKNGRVIISMGDKTYDITEFIIDEINMKDIISMTQMQILLTKTGIPLKHLIADERKTTLDTINVFDIDLREVDSKYLKNSKLGVHIIDDCKIEEIAYHFYFNLTEIGGTQLIIDKSNEFLILTQNDWNLIKDKNELDEFIKRRKNKTFVDAINELNENMDKRKEIETRIEKEVFECLEKLNIDELDKNKISFSICAPSEGIYRKPDYKCPILRLYSKDGEEFISYVIDSESEKEKRISVTYWERNPRILLIDKASGTFGVYRNFAIEDNALENRRFIGTICINKFLNNNGESSLVEKDISSIKA